MKGTGGGDTTGRTRRLTRLATGAIILSTLASAQVRWGTPPEGYTVSADGSHVSADDGGGSTADRYLLSVDDQTDFILECSVRRARPDGEKARAIVVWRVQNDAPANRISFFLPTARIPANRALALRLVVIGDQAQLSIDGQVTQTQGIAYGEPPKRGRIGFLHYFNYAYVYDNVKLTPIDAANLPSPTMPESKLSATGVLELSWAVPEPYRGAVRTEVYRRFENVNNEVLLGTTIEAMYADRSLASNQQATYRLRLAAGAGKGPFSPPCRVATGALPPPAAPREATATERIDGSLRLRWQTDSNARYSGWIVTQNPGLDTEVSHTLSPETTSMVLPPGGPGRCRIAALSPEGPGPAIEPIAAPHAPECMPALPFPTQHPYLLYNQGQIDRARHVLNTDTTARTAVSIYARPLLAATTTPAEIPEKPRDQYSSVTNRWRDAGVAYQLTQDETLAQWVRQAIVGLAQAFPSMPVRQRKVRLAETISGLYEAMWVVPVLLAYDLTWESPAYSPADHALIETQLLRPAAELFVVPDYNDATDPRPGDLHYKCYNFEAWFISVAGLTGLLLKDPDLVEHAIDGPYGLKHLLAHDIHDDGVFWERSMGYHGFVLYALHPFLEAAGHCNLDLYGLAVADDYNVDREPLVNYCVGDGDNGPKSLRLFFQGPFFLTFPDLTWPQIADSSRGPMRADDIMLAAWTHYGDDRLAWLLSRDGFAPGGPSRVPSQPGDAEADVRFAYDAEHVYIAADIRDQVVRNSHADPAEAWNGDALWIGLKWSKTPNAPYDHIYGFTPGDGEACPPRRNPFHPFRQAVGQSQRRPGSLPQNGTGLQYRSCHSPGGDADHRGPGEPLVTVPPRRR